MIREGRRSRPMGRINGSEPGTTDEILQKTAAKLLAGDVRPRLHSLHFQLIFCRPFGLVEVDHIQ